MHNLWGAAAHCYYFYLVRRYPKVLSFGRSFLTAPDFQSSMSNTRLPGISLSFSFYIFFAYLLSILFKFLLGLHLNSRRESFLQRPRISEMILCGFLVKVAWLVRAKLRCDRLTQKFRSIRIAIANRILHFNLPPMSPIKKRFKSSI